MKNVIEFIKWGLTHVKKASVPNYAILPIPYEEVGSAGEWEYLFGTTGRKVTKSLIESKYKSYYHKNGWTRAQYDKATKGWVEAGKTVCDCQGVEDYYSTSDTNANGNYMNYCTSKGLCSQITRPYVIGEAVFNGTSSRKTHVGWVCGFTADGDVLVMEERGLAYGFVVTRMSKRSWKYRGLMTKRYSYDSAEKQPENRPLSDNGATTFTRVLKYGVKGNDVIELKKLLIAKGYGKGITTNTSSSRNFYGSTRTAVKNFQRDNGLTIDGKAGKKTITALGGKLNG